MKITGHVGLYKVKESFKFFHSLDVPKDSIICCGIVADPTVHGHIWKGWHFAKDSEKAFNSRDKFLNPGYFAAYSWNQMYLDWTKLERVTP